MIYFLMLCFLLVISFIAFRKKPSKPIESFIVKGNRTILLGEFTSNPDTSCILLEITSEIDIQTPWLVFTYNNNLEIGEYKHGIWVFNFGKKEFTAKCIRREDRLIFILENDLVKDI